MLRIMPETPPGLGELVDYECRLMLDEADDASRIDARDRALLRLLPDWERDARPRALRRWLAGQRHSLPGQRLSTFARLLLLALLAAAFLTGASLALGCLARPGPADLALALGLLVGLQLAFLGVMLLASLVGLPIAPLGNLLTSLLIRLGPLRRFQQRHAQACSPQRLAARLQLHRSLLRRLAWGLSQRAGLWFNLGMLGMVGLLVTFSDLRFTWNSSLPPIEQGQRLLTFTHLLATPWSGWWPQAVPDSELIGASFGTIAAGDGRWWPFVFMCLLVYGLLPRLLLAIIADRLLRRGLRHLAFDDARSIQTWQRLRELHNGFRRAAPGAHQPERAPLAAQPCLLSEELDVLPWQDVPLDETRCRELIHDRYHCSLGRWLTSSTEAVRGHAVLLLAESWEAPSKAVRRQLRQLRQRIGPQATLIVGLIDGQPPHWARADDEDRAMWQRRLDELTDPLLRIESLIP